MSAGDYLTIIVTILLAEALSVFWAIGYAKGRKKGLLEAHRSPERKT